MRKVRVMQLNWCWETSETVLRLLGSQFDKSHKVLLCAENVSVKELLLPKHECGFFPRLHSEVSLLRFTAQLGHSDGPHSLHILFSQCCTLLNIEEKILRWSHIRPLPVIRLFRCLDRWSWDGITWLGAGMLAEAGLRQLLNFRSEIWKSKQ